MSWAFLVYAIDILSTDGKYGGWGFLLFFAMIGYAGLWVARLCEAEEAANNAYNFHNGKVLTLAKDYDTLTAGEKIVISDLTDNGMKVRYPNGSTSSRVSRGDIEQVVAPEVGSKPLRDVLKPLRRLVATFAIFCILGIGYANFMPSKDTAYKMLAAYVGQTVVETPEVRETAGNAIDFLNKAIKKYSVELDKEEAAAEKPAKAETKPEGNQQEK